MTAYQHRPRLHEPEHTPEPDGDWREAMVAACITVVGLGVVVGVPAGVIKLFQLMGWA